MPRILGMRRLTTLVVSLLLVPLAGCSGGSAGTAATTAPLDGGTGGPGPVPGLHVDTGIVASGVASGASCGALREGRSYDVTITSESGKDIAFTVHEPAWLDDCTKTPLILHSHGFGLNRAHRRVDLPDNIPLMDVLWDVTPYLRDGYGVISIDERGFGQSTGTSRVMDPDFEGRDLVRILDWAEDHLPWLAYRDRNLLLGAIGGSYGGGYQLLLLRTDPKRRLDAIVPQITWYDLTYSLAPGGVPKTTYTLLLTVAAEAWGFRFDPEFFGAVVDGLAQNQLPEATNDALLYHSPRYACEGMALPGHPAAEPLPRIDALFLQGMADALFDVNEGVANYECLRARGGDVRLYTYQFGHILPKDDSLIWPPPNSVDDLMRCGPLQEVAVELAWFDAKLRGNVHAIDDLPELCIALDSAGDAIVPDSIHRGGTNVAFRSRAFSLDLLGNQPVELPVYTARRNDVIAGIPTARFHTAAATGFPESGDPRVFVGIGIKRADSARTVLIDDQVRPIRGFGDHDVELNAIGERLHAGDQLMLLVYGYNYGYFLTGTRNPFTSPLVVSGEVGLPMLGAVPTYR